MQGLKKRQMRWRDLKPILDAEGIEHRRATTADHMTLTRGMDRVTIKHRTGGTVVGPMTLAQIKKRFGIDAL